MTAPDLKEPCGECYLPSRETCDICGAIGPSPKVIASLPERIWTASTNGKCHVGFDTPSLNYTNEYVRADLARPTPLAEALAVPEVKALVKAVGRFEKLMQTQMRTADFHSDGCGCIRCAEDAMFVALRAIEEGKP